MSDDDFSSRTVIGARTAIVLYVVLIILAIATLKGEALAVALLIVLGLAAKSFIDHLRRKME